MAEHDSDPKDEEAETETQSSTSTLQAWFPLWGGWYADKDVTQTDATFVRQNLKNLTVIRNKSHKFKFSDRSQF